MVFIYKIIFILEKIYDEKSIKDYLKMNCNILQKIHTLDVWGIPFVEGFQGRFCFF